MQCPDCTTFHFLWCLRIASFGAVTNAVSAPTLAIYIKGFRYPKLIPLLKVHKIIFIN